MKQFEMMERGTDRKVDITVIVAGSQMTLIGPNRNAMTMFVPFGYQAEVLRTMRRRDPVRLGKLLDELEAINEC